MAKKEITVSIPKSEMEALGTALLADECGISEEAYEILSKYLPSSIVDEVEVTDGRVFLAEDDLEDDDKDEDDDDFDDFDDEDDEDDEDDDDDFEDE